MMTESGRQAIDVGQSIDNGPWTSFQKVAVLLAALSILFDGFDGQLIGYAIPVIMREWNVSSASFAPVVAIGLVGMGVGAACAGYVCDRFGRRRAIIGSVLLFGVATACIGLSQNLAMIAAFRFLAGLGIGGALPSASAFTAEVTSAKRRTLAITATIVCVPLGGMVAGLYAGYVLAHFDWRTLFFIGGAMPAAFSAILFLSLPESPRFLVRRPARWPELAQLLRRMSRAADDDAVFSDVAEQRLERREGWAALFESDRIRDTLALWGAFFLCLLSVYTAFSWLPTMLTSEGLNVANAGAGLTAYNFGGVFGALGCAVAITRYGSRWPIILCAAGAAASAFILQDTPIANTSVLIFGLGVHGLFVNAVQATMFALAAHVYPTNVRATGTAAALVFGRLGAIFSAFAGAAVIMAGGATAYFGMLAVAMTGVLIALVLVKNHTARVGFAAPGARPAEKPLS